MSGRPLRIACLHGYCQSSLSFRRKTGALRKSLTRPIAALQADVESGSSTPSYGDTPIAELVYIDAPFALEEHLTPPTTPLSYPAGENNYAVLRPAPIRFEAFSATPDPTPRTWWVAERQASVYVGVDQTIAYLKDVFRENHIDGLLGFSQGATVVSLICAMREQPVFDSLRFALLFSGFPSRATLHQPLYEISIKVPSLHVWGEQDEIVPPKACEALYERFDSGNRSQYVHQKGHLVPGDAGARRAVSQFLLPFVNEITGRERKATL
ncbi:Serine hydrolase (FSH1) [Gracilaria domingensis]|nr:Serine hydrolase (FSH1) [Gracilaria domingensis]